MYMYMYILDKKLFFTKSAELVSLDNLDISLLIDILSLLYVHIVEIETGVYCQKLNTNFLGNL